jgi:hypothetical protein
LNESGKVLAKDIRRIPRTIDRWQDEPGADNFSEAVRQIIDVALLLPSRLVPHPENQPKRGRS